jgi:hypothetical protein
LVESELLRGAAVRFDDEEGATGWNAPPSAAWLKHEASGE